MLPYGLPPPKAKRWKGIWWFTTVFWNLPIHDYKFIYDDDNDGGDDDNGDDDYYNDDCDNENNDDYVFDDDDG